MLREITIDGFRRRWRHQWLWRLVCLLWLHVRERVVAAIGLLLLLLLWIVEIGVVGWILRGH
jgi:hypothetical protein